jgi:predicted ArsR family transcriptional regulator
MATLITRLNGPAGRVLAQLRHGPKTVEELSRTLRLTANAVRNQLRKLEQSNYVSRSGLRPSASKPSVLYSITLEGQIQFSTIYLPILSQFLRVAEGRCSDTQLQSFMADTGKSMGARFTKPKGDLKARVGAGARLLKTFGGITDVRARNGSFVIRSAGCPLAALTSDNDAACNILVGLLGDYLAASVKSCCETGAAPRCCFEIRS